MVDTPPAGTHVYTPTELNGEVRLHIEAGFPQVWLSGEISNLSRPASGHMYFSLKDDRAQVRCALFRGKLRAASVQPENGLAVIAAGRLSLFEPRGDYQLIVDRLIEAGAGALQQAFEALKKKLEAEGLFAAERKRPLPPMPARLGVLTSPSGAAVRDIVHVIRRRWPLTDIRIYATPVQGDEAAPGVIRALRAAARHGWAETLIIARGGGSLEDLWPFNDETLARTIAESPVPVISAVGHETDFSIADFVADVRAPTPSAAAELAVPDRRPYTERLRRCATTLERQATRRLDTAAQTLDHLQRRLNGRHPRRRLDDHARRLEELRGRLARHMRATLVRQTRRLEQAAGRLGQQSPDRRVSRAGRELESLNARLERAARNGLEQRGQRLTGAARALEAVNPLAVLGRGYALVIDETGRAVTERESFTRDRDLKLLMHEFSVPVRVTGPTRER